MFAMEKEGGVSCPNFVGNHMTAKEEGSLCHCFIPQGWWVVKISDYCYAPGDTMGYDRSVLTGDAPGACLSLSRKSYVTQGGADSLSLL